MLRVNERARSADQEVLQGAPVSHWRRTLCAVAALEPLILLALAPFFWFPGAWSGLLLLVLPLLWIIRWAAHRRLTVRTSYDIPVVCFLLLLPVALLPVVDWTLAMPKLYGLLLGIAVMYALPNALLTRQQALFGLYASMLVLGAGLVAIGLIGTDWTANKFLPFGAIYDRMPLFIRGLSKTTTHGGLHPNQLGGALALLFPLVINGTVSYLRTARAGGWGFRWMRLCLGSLCVVLVFLLLLTQSRSGYAGVAVGALVILGWWIRPMRGWFHYRPLTFALSTIAVIAMGWLAWRAVPALMTMGDFQLDWFPGRSELWDRGLTAVQDFPFTGVGLSQFSRVLHVFYYPSVVPPTFDVGHAHNFFLQLALDFGIPGTMALLSVLVSFFRRMWEVCHLANDLQLRAAAVGLGAGMVSFLVFGLADALVLGARGAVVFWIVLGLGSAIAQVAELAKPQPT